MKRRVVVAFCPQERPALETWHEALKFAGVHKLPILYVIQNGVADQQLSSEHAPHLEPFSFMARDYGYPGIIVDGQDVVAVWRVAQESIHRARQGSGPTLIDCRTDSKRDPLAYMEHYMRKRNVWDDGWKKDTEQGIQDEIEKATALVPAAVISRAPFQLSFYWGDRTGILSHASQEQIPRCARHDNSRSRCHPDRELQLGWRDRYRPQYCIRVWRSFDSGRLLRNLTPLRMTLHVLRGGKSKPPRHF